MYSKKTDLCLWHMGMNHVNHWLPAHVQMQQGFSLFACYIAVKEPCRHCMFPLVHEATPVGLELLTQYNAGAGAMSKACLPA